MAASFSLTGTIRLTPTWTEPLDLVDVVDRTVIAETLALVDGTGSGQGNFYWKDVRTIAAYSSALIDLSALPLAVYGGSATVATSQLRLIYFKNRSTSDMEYRINGNRAPISMEPGSVFLWYTPSNAFKLPIFGASPARIQVDNVSPAAGDFEIVLAGVKA